MHSASDSIAEQGGGNALHERTARNGRNTGAGRARRREHRAGTDSRYGKAHTACGAAGAAEGTPNSEPDRRKGRSGAARRARSAERLAADMPAETGACLRGACRRPRGTRLRRGQLCRREQRSRRPARRGVRLDRERSPTKFQGAEKPLGPLRPHIIRQRRAWTGSSGRCTGRPCTRAYCRRPLRR